MKWFGRGESDNVEDRRGFGGTGLAVGGTGGLIIALLAWFLGFNPSQVPVPQSNNPNHQATRSTDPAEDREVHFTKVVLHDTEVVWGDVFQKMGRRYQEPKLVLFSSAVQSACGTAQSAVGPFYCPRDSKVYIDLSFYRDMQRKLQAPGDFARAYVIAHEVGHHVQHLLGFSRAMESGAWGGRVEHNHASVRNELQADFLAGVWAHYAQEKFNFLESGDLQSALNAAYQIGDDRLQRRSQGYVVPDSFTHGTSDQRMKAFGQGFETGNLRLAAQYLPSHDGSLDRSPQGNNGFLGE